MGARLRPWWQQIKKHRVAIGVVAMVLVVAIALIIVGYWFDWTGFNGYNKITVAHTISGTNTGTVIKTEEYQPGKGLWDWLQLLFVPAILTLGAVCFTARQNHDIQIARAQHENDRMLAERQSVHERDIALENQRETTLQTYLDNMSELLLHENLSKSQRGDVVANIAHARTSTALSKLDSNRKRIVILFLAESRLIDRGRYIIDMSFADLRGVDLSQTKKLVVSPDCF